jgi:transposase
MSFVPIKGVEQQGLSMLHSARSQLIGQRTQLTNAVRGHLSEFGIVAERGSEATHDGTCGTDGPRRQIEMISTEIVALDSTLRKENKASELGPRRHGLRRC